MNERIMRFYIIVFWGIIPLFLLAYQIFGGSIQLAYWSYKYKNQPLPAQFKTWCNGNGEYQVGIDDTTKIVYDDRNLYYNSTYGTAFGSYDKAKGVAIEYVNELKEQDKKDSLENFHPCK